MNPELVHNKKQLRCRQPDSALLLDGMDAPKRSLRSRLESVREQFNREYSRHVLATAKRDIKHSSRQHPRYQLNLPRFNTAVPKNWRKDTGLTTCGLMREDQAFNQMNYVPANCSR